MMPKGFSGFFWIAFACCCFIGTPVPGEEAASGTTHGPGTEKDATGTPATPVSVEGLTVAPDSEDRRLLDLSLLPEDPAPGEHPLAPAVRWAKQGLVELEKVEDYCATLVKRERNGSQPGEYEYILVKIREKPFSVYLHFLGPPHLEGQEVIYMEGQNDGKMLAHGVGMQKALFGTVAIRPDGFIAMRGQNYPLTEIGIRNLVRRLIEVGEQDMQYDECEVKYFENAKINGRPCTCVQVMHPVPRKNFIFHIARIFIDKELNIPIRYAAYDWPTEEGGKPQLIEEYTYLDFKANNGFTDADFDIHNPNYGFMSK